MTEKSRVPVEIRLRGKPLSPRQTEVVELVALGLRNKEIACLMGISEQTVKNHLTATMHKAGQHSRTEVAIAHLMEKWR